MFEWTLPLGAEATLFAFEALVIGAAGTKLANLADRLADRSGLGEAITGVVFLGFITALPGLVASVVAALDGHPALAISNAMGGIAVQTVALPIADLAYRKANLEHAAASAANLMQATVLVLLVTLPLTGIAGPDVTIGHVHPTTLLLFGAAASAFWLVLRTQEEPMWRPRPTDETVEDVPDPEYQTQSLPKLITGVLLLAVVTATSGAAVAESAENLVAMTGFAEVVIGGLFMGVATSLPELVTSMAAVREGALTLAVSDIVGGNFFDVLFVAAADLAFLPGSIYHGSGVGDREIFLIALTILLNVTFLGGLLYRQKTGPAKIGIEGVTMILTYGLGFLVLSLAM
ncbi:MAG: hypothetical protein R3304_05935 [Longimicrobiales bacterium]|nr:hypothetical protein [Longimicrobiales bacterium]